jgi:hypothetical protein
MHTSRTFSGVVEDGSYSSLLQLVQRDCEILETLATRKVAMQRREQNRCCALAKARFERGDDLRALVNINRRSSQFDPHHKPLLLFHKEDLHRTEEDVITSRNAARDEQHKHQDARARCFSR